MSIIKGILIKRNFKYPEKQYTEKFVNENADCLDWIHFCYNADFSLFESDFLRKFACELDWEEISYNRSLTEDFIRKFKDKVNWNYIGRYQKLSEDFIREFKEEEINWVSISEAQVISEGFIREFQEKVYWSHIAMYQKLSDGFIREFNDRINWSAVSLKVDLSENFLRKFKDKINWNYVKRTIKKRKLSSSFKIEFSKELEISKTNLFFMRTKQYIEQLKK